ncbi:uncharacterized protein EV422DRAFT_615025 [Fimicolochytrium jonesii]|uniref:uncharacterized protein n=1 Tax=Fimicolochytrium jonesii TaxID=1396493 RepID=UPI0022FF3A90|nr:uncharacterized protein EV422DRAFT_615025 [Fimicolochytrium jonesii]KAI8821687.1 hypothetical protein EV422DRAFT_615025 [Fimicolochytrium jonesii]
MPFQIVDMAAFGGMSDVGKLVLFEAVAFFILESLVGIGSLALTIVGPTKDGFIIPRRPDLAERPFGVLLDRNNFRHMAWFGKFIGIEPRSGEKEWPAMRERSTLHVRLGSVSPPRVISRPLFFRLELVLVLFRAGPGSSRLASVRGALAELPWERALMEIKFSEEKKNESKSSPKKTGNCPRNDEGELESSSSLDFHGDGTDGFAGASDGAGCFPWVMKLIMFSMCRKGWSWGTHLPEWAVKLMMQEGKDLLAPADWTQTKLSICELVDGICVAGKQACAAGPAGLAPFCRLVVTR